MLALNESSVFGSSLELNRARALSASQSSLVSGGLSKLGGKLNRVFSRDKTKQTQEKTTTLERQKKQRKLPEIRQSQENLLSFLYGHQEHVNPLSGRSAQNYSDLVLRNIPHQENLRPRENSRYELDKDLPDIHRHQR